jgi:hypothetical protein
MGRNLAQLAFSSAGHFSISLLRVDPIPDLPRAGRKVKLVYGGKGKKIKPRSF